MSDILYHGSPYKLSSLDGNNPGYAGSLGYGLYLTYDEDFAMIFGEYIHRVISPVPDDLVVYLDVVTYECGNDLTLYTTGSSPFTFVIEDRHTGAKHTYSVLGDCEETVVEETKNHLLRSFKTTSVPARVLDLVKMHLAKGLPMWQIDFYYDMEDELDRLDREIGKYLETELDGVLGEQVDLSDLSNICEKHGYSAFFIDGYAPGNEYVIFDDNYLPVKPLRDDG